MLEDPIPLHCVGITKPENQVWIRIDRDSCTCGVSDFEVAEEISWILRMTTPGQRIILDSDGLSGSTLDYLLSHLDYDFDLVVKVSKNSSATLSDFTH